MLDTKKPGRLSILPVVLEVLLILALAVAVPLFTDSLGVKTYNLYGASIDGSVTKEGYGLYVDGTLIAACDREEELQSALEEITASAAEAYGAPEGVHTLTNKTELCEGRYAGTLFADKAGLCSLLGCRDKGFVFDVYTANGADTDIVLGVSTAATVVLEEQTEAPYNEIGTDLLDVGESVTVKEGVAGTSLNRYSLTYINGVQSDKKLIDSTVINEPVVGELWYGTQSGATLMGADELFMLPCGGLVTSWYGGRTLWGDYDFHDGIDFAGIGAGYGDPIYAAADGIVSFAAYHGGFGNKIIVDHSKEISTLYAHCSKILVSEGDAVVKGQIIGYIGNTGRVTGPHLHLEVLVNGLRTNPKKYLDWSAYEGIVYQTSKPN